MTARLGDVRRVLMAEVRAMQDDKRYGSWTNPVMLGLLIAVEHIDQVRTDAGAKG